MLKPLGLMIEKWMVYYYPILESEIYLPQINGANTRIAFEEPFKPILNYYKNRGALSAFYNELRTKKISHEINHEFFALSKQIRNTICKMPMKYMGRSISEDFYSIFQYKSDRQFRNNSAQNLKWLIDDCGTFTISIEYYEAFKILGSFISGTDNILFKWAEFSAKASGNKIKTEKVIHEILRNPVTDRDIANSKKLYKEILKTSGEVICVWSGNKITSYDIDHIIPFSIWKNNDLWNLLPVQSKINNQKSDKIPSANIISKRKEIIIHYWELLNQKHQDVFLDEIQISLLGNNSKSNWQNTAFEQLLNTSKYLIETRGYEEWKM